MWQSINSKSVYIAAFLGQNISLFIGMWLYYKNPAFFLIPVLLTALLFYFIYHRINMPSMWSYLGLQCVSAVSYYILEIMLMEQRNKGKALPPNCLGPILYVMGIIMILIMALLPVLPVCIAYRNNHSHLSPPKAKAEQ